jgi:hypothetical protein
VIAFVRILPGPVRILAFCLVAVLFACPPFAARAAVLDGLQASHPRLLFPAARTAELRAMAAADPLLAELIEVVREQAVLGLAEPIIRRRLDDPADPERRMKDERRAAMYRIFNMGVTYRLTEDPALADQMADRIKAELLAAANFTDWYPSHFLNIGEMSALMAVGYDWIHERLTPTERATIVAGIRRNGLLQGKAAYDGNHGWTRSTNNWNQVCNSGLLLAALAVAEDEPALAEEIAGRAIASIRSSMVNFNPDGAWNEGPTYWAYGTTYNALMFAALRTALGDLRGLQNADGYEAMGKSGAFHIQTIGPKNLYFNYGDSKQVAYFAPVLFALAKEFNQPAYAFYQRRVAEQDLPRMRSGQLMQDDTLDRFLALLVVWYDRSGQSITYDDLPLDQHFRGDASVGAMRGGWTDPDAVYLGFKGGYNQSAHGHLDIGSFVLDADGVRWVRDLGGDSYALPGYWEFGTSGRRWNYYRLSNRGHSTLTINNANQNVFARVPLARFETTPELAFSSLDMTAAYGGQASSVRRGFALLDRRRVVVQDRVQGLASGAVVRWGLITGADVALHGESATLTLDGKTLEARILEPAGASFSVLSTNPHELGGAHPDEHPNPGTRMLAVVWTAPAAGATLNLSVSLTPLRAGEPVPPAPTFRPLDPPPVVTPGDPLRAAIAPEATAYVRAGASYAHLNQMSEANRAELRVKRETTSPPGNFHREAYLRFPIGGVDGKVTGATLRLFSTQSPGVANDVSVAGNLWEEDTITYNNRPARQAAFTGFARFTPVAASWSEVDVGAAVLAARAAGESAITFNLHAATAHDSTTQYASRHYADASVHPRLVLHLAPTVTVEANEPVAHEFGARAGSFLVRRNHPASTALDVAYALGGTAGAGTDYVAPPGTARIAAGATSVAVAITPVPDDLPEGDETVVLTLSAGAAYTLGAPAQATVTIKDRPADDWRFRHGLSGPGVGGGDQEDPAGEGVPALLRYALGVAPAEAAPAHLPRLDSVRDGAGETWWMFGFARPSPAPEDIDYVVEASADLASWGPVPPDAELDVRPDSEGRERVTVALPAEGRARVFMRLRAQRR